MTSGPPLTAAVVSPLRVVTHGVSSLLREHPEVVEVVELRTGPGHADPDVIVYDAMGLLDGGGTDLDFFVGGTTSSVLALGQHLRPELTARALAHGAHSACSIQVDDEGLLAAVLAASVPSTSVEQVRGLGHDVGLTRREVDILTLITQGHTNLEIAQLRYLSINSVKTYIRSAYRRIGVTTRSQAVAWCVQNGFATVAPAA